MVDKILYSCGRMTKRKMQDDHIIVQTREFHDCLLLLEGYEAIQAHRVILSSQSSVFKMTFTSDARERETQQIDMSMYIPQAVRHFINMFYEKVALQAADRVEVYKLAHMYEANGKKISKQLKLFLCRYSRADHSNVYSQHSKSFL